MSHHEYFGNGYNFQQISSPDFHNYRSHGWDRGFRSGPSWQGAGSSGWDHMGGRGRREHPIMGLPDLTGRRGHRFDRGSGFPGSSNRGGRPAHLKGREIGMYYKHLSQKKKKKKIKVPIVELSPESQKKIQELLLSLDRNFAENMSLEAYEDTHFKQEYLDITTISFNKKLSESMEMGSSIEVPQGMDQELRDEHLKRLTNPAYLKMLDIRKQLPAYQKRSEILKCIRENQIAVISGDTGCGKTTQVGQLILDEALMAGTGARTRVLITQPRRIAATSVARRIANERVETLGNSVGYTIRLDSVVPRQNGSLEVVTAGVVLQRLQSDPALLSISHLLIDEVHERDATCDILLGIVKLILTKRKNLKLILMSATMDAERFSQYFGGCPLLHIPGIMFPIKEYYLEDVLELTRFQAWRAPNETQGPRRMWRQRERQRNQLIMQHEELFGPYIQLLRQSGRYNEATLRSLMLPESEILNMELAASLVRVLCAKRPPGAILVFLPGMSHISKLCSLLEDPKYPLPPHILLPLHSLLNSTDQNAIFDSPPNGVRKIIVSTNIAETSITIDDVVYVVDCGRMKLGDYDVGTDVQILQSEWVSQANAHQRRGRAGRVQAGECYRLYTRLRSDLLLPRPSPQLLRAPVHEPLLAILLLRLRPQFLSSLIDPPDPAALATAVTLLRRTGVLTSDESLTPLGVHVARLPVAPGAARMLIFASLFSAVAPISSVAAVVAFRDPFILPIGKEKEVEYARLKLSHGSSSDQLAAAEAQRLWAELSRPRGETFCHQHFLSARTMRLLASMREQFGELLHRAHFIPSTDPDSPLCNRNSNRGGLLKALIVAGLFPNVASYYSTGMRLSTLEDGRVTVHPGSVNARKKVRPAGHLVYRLKQRSTDLFLHDTSPAHAIPLIFFGDNFQISDMDDQMSLVTCGGLQWRAEKETGRLLSALRGALHKLLQLRLERPRPVNWNSSEGQLLEAIIELITTEDNPNLAMERQSMPNDQVDDEDEDQSSSEEEGDDFIPLAKRPSKSDSSRQCRV